MQRHAKPRHVDMGRTQLLIETLRLLQVTLLPLNITPCWKYFTEHLLGPQGSLQYQRGGFAITTYCHPFNDCLQPPPSSASIVKQPRPLDPDFDKRVTSFPK